MKLQKYISTYRLQHIYIVNTITINKLEQYIKKYQEIYSMIKSDPKGLPKADDINAEKTAGPIVKTNPPANSAKVI